MAQLRAGQPAELGVEGALEPVPVTVRTATCDQASLAVVPPPALRGALRAGAKIVVRFNSPGGRHEARSTIVGVEMIDDDTADVAIGALEGMRTSQRRQFFRVSAALPVELLLPAANGLPMREDKRGVTLDLSAGGLRFDTVLALAAEQRLRVLMRLPPELQRSPNEVLVAEARVVRAESTFRRGEKVVRAAVEFSFRREVERDRWVQLSLALQRQALPGDSRG
jgi:hypothetical protein